MIRAAVVFAFVSLWASQVRSQVNGNAVAPILENQYASISNPWRETSTSPAVDCATAVHPWLTLKFSIVPGDSGKLGMAFGKLLAVEYRKPKMRQHDPGPCTRIRGEVQIELREKPPKGRFKDDAVKLDPKHNEVLLENDRVRVVRVHFAAGESGPIVDKRARVIVVLTDSHATVTLPDGHSEVRDGKAGTISFGNAGRQATNNIGNTPLENIVVELKSK